MPHVATFVLVDKMPGNVGVIILEFFVSRLDLMFVFLNVLILVGVDEPGFKEKIPELIKAHTVAKV